MRSACLGMARDTRVSSEQYLLIHTYLGTVCDYAGKADLSKRAVGIKKNRVTSIFQTEIIEPKFAKKIPYIVCEF